MPWSSIRPNYVHDVLTKLKDAGTGRGDVVSNRLSSRLSRLLNLVPYFIANPGMSAAEAAAELGVTTTQLMSDLNQLWVCGLPGYGPATSSTSRSPRRASR